VQLPSKRICPNCGAGFVKLDTVPGPAPGGGQYRWPGFHQECPNCRCALGARITRLGYGMLVVLTLAMAAFVVCMGMFPSWQNSIAAPVILVVIIGFFSFCISQWGMRYVRIAASTR